MYRDFFGIEQKPFSIAPDPSFLYMSDGHREALAHLRFGLENEGCFVLLTGEIGTGKTTVCRSLLEQVPEGANIAYIVNPKLTSVELLATICDEFGIQYPGKQSVKILIDLLNIFLFAAHAKGQRTVLIIDEAQTLDDDVLEEIRLLTNLETNKQKLLQVILLGQPELLKKLEQPALAPFSQRISARFHLDPLNMEESKAYVLHRLSVAGMPPETFTGSSLKELFEVTGGIPRLMNMVCDRALLGAYGSGVKQVSTSIIKKAAKEVYGRDLKKDATPVVSPKLIAAVTAGVCALVLFFISLSGPTQEEGRMPPAVASVERESGAAGESVKSSAHSEPVLIMPEPTDKQEREEIDLPPVVWPAGEMAARSEDFSFQTLLKLWGISGFNPGQQWACQFAEDRGLRCLAKQGSIESILRLNRPAILRLINDDDQAFFMVLRSIDGNIATFTLGETVARVALDDMALRWSGYFILLWKPPPGYVDSIRPGHKGQEVEWLAAKLAAVDGEGSTSAEPKINYDTTLVDKVRKFQFAHSLVPDGIAGKETLIMMNTLAGENIPVLQPPEQ